MIIVRQEEKKDVAAVRSVHLAAFPTSKEADLVDALRATSYYDRELSLIAEEDGVIVGHILFNRIVIKENHHTYPALALASLAVSPQVEEDVSSLLITKGLERCKYLGHKLVTVLESTSYYKRFGFEPAELHEITTPACFPEDSLLIYPLSESVSEIKGMVVYPREFNMILGQ